MNDTVDALRATLAHYERECNKLRTQCAACPYRKEIMDAREHLRNRNESED